MQRARSGDAGGLRRDIAAAAHTQKLATDNANTNTCRTRQHEHKLELKLFGYRGGIPITKPERLREEHTNGGVVRACPRHWMLPRVPLDQDQYSAP
eukprot:scaffold5608_cov43-Phaeocystis_antarctica.AAC.1